MKAVPSENPESWVDEHGDYLFRYAATRLRDRDAAEEVVQQTFVAGVQHQNQFAGDGSARGWLLGILKRKIVDLIRDRQKRGTSINEEDYESRYFNQSGWWRSEVRNASQPLLSSMERQEFWETFQKCLAALTQRQADIFVLREMQEQSTEEICKDLDISASNLWVTLHRARLQLAHCMKQRWLN